MRQTQGTDAAIGAVFAIGGAIAALHFFGATSTPAQLTIQPPPVPPIPQMQFPQFPQVPAPTPPTPQVEQPVPPAPPAQPPQTPELQFDPQRFFQWLRLPAGSPIASTGFDLAAMSPEELRDRIGNRVYRLVEGGCGSFPIASDKIATALHCVTSSTVEFQTPDGSQSFPGQLIWSDEGTDAAVFQVGVPLEPFQMANAQQGEPVWAIGYPIVTGGRLTVTPSHVVSVDSATGREAGLSVPLIEVPDQTYFKGNSGGPLLNQRGQVVGFAHAITEVPPYVGFAVPVSVLPR